MMILILTKMIICNALSMEYATHDLDDVQFFCQLKLTTDSGTDLTYWDLEFELRLFNLCDRYLGLCKCFLRS